MAKWTLEDRERKTSGEVYVLDEEESVNLPRMRKWLIYSTPKVEFRLLQEMHKAKVPAHDENDMPVLDKAGKTVFTEMLVPRKTVGYMLKYNYREPYTKFHTFNSFGILYNKKPVVNKEEVDLQIVYEDKVIRLLAYEHRNKVKDYWMIGRWRSDNSNCMEDE